MAAVWNAWGFLGLVAGLFAAGLGWVVYVYNPRRGRNRWLALTLFFEGAAVLAGAGLMYLVDDAPSAYAFQAVSLSAALTLPSLYLLVIGCLDHPLAHWLRVQGVRAGVIAAGIALEAWWFLRPTDFLVRVAEPPYRYAAWDAEYGAAFVWVARVLAAVWLFGLVVSAAMFRRAPSPLARRRSRALLIAFAVRGAVTAIGPALFVLARGQTDPANPIPWVLGLALTILLYFPFYGLLAYGILSSNLFDIRLRVRWTVRQSTVAAVFIAIPFIVYESVTQYFVPRLGPYLGILAAGVLVFFLAPIQRLAERVARVTVPARRSHAELSHVERRRVFQEQVELAWQDGALTVKERHLLDRLRDRLGLSTSEAAEIEGGHLRRAPAQRGREARRAAGSR